jgi:hypothetical protein
MTTMPTATVDITTPDRKGRPEPVYHGALCTLTDAFRAVQHFTPAPVGPWVRQRIETAGGGSFSIGEFDVSITTIGLRGVSATTL